MKHINNSESTYGQLHFYFIEGSKSQAPHLFLQIIIFLLTKQSDFLVCFKAPLSGPTNISTNNVTQNSMVLQWSSIPEDNLRGFLLGYMINYTAYQKETQSKHLKLTCS